MLTATSPRRAARPAELHRPAHAFADTDAETDADTATDVIVCGAGPAGPTAAIDLGAAAAPPSPHSLNIYAVGGRGDFRDASDHVSCTYGMSSGHRVLARPEGYLAAVVDTTGLNTVTTYLDTNAVRSIRRRDRGSEAVLRKLREKA